MNYNILVLLLNVISLLFLWRFVIYAKKSKGFSLDNIVKTSYKMLTFAVYFILMTVSYLMMFNTNLVTLVPAIKIIVILTHSAISGIFMFYLIKCLLLKH